MKTPTWIYITGVCFLLFGSCGGLNNVQSLMMPEMIEMQKDMLESYQIEEEDENIQDSLRTEIIITENDDTTKIDVDNQMEVFENLFSITDKQKKALKTYAYIGLFVSLLFVITGILWLIPQKISLNLAYFTLAVGIIFCVIRAYFTLTNAASGSLLFVMNSGHILGAFFHVCLLVFILASDRGTFKQYINSQ